MATESGGSSIRKAVRHGRAEPHKAEPRKGWLVRLVGGGCQFAGQGGQGFKEEREDKEDRKED